MIREEESVHLVNPFLSSQLELVQSEGVPSPASGHHNVRSCGPYRMRGLAA